MDLIQKYPPLMWKVATIWLRCPYLALTLAARIQPKRIMRPIRKWNWKTLCQNRWKGIFYKDTHQTNKQTIQRISSISFFLCFAHLSILEFAKVYVLIGNEEVWCHFLWKLVFVLHIKSLFWSIHCFVFCVTFNYCVYCLLQAFNNKHFT